MVLSVKNMNTTTVVLIMYMQMFFFICEKGRYRLKSLSSTQCRAPISRPGGGKGVTIRTFKAALKNKMENLKGKWVEYLPDVLWAYRTTRRSATQETPFALAFGTETVAPVEVGLKSPRIEFANTEHNKEILRLNLDLL